MAENKENSENGNPCRINLIKKRDGRVVEFTKEKITNAIFNAAKAVGGHDRRLAENLADKVSTILEFKYDVGEIPTVEEVQDIVETVLIKSGHAKTAKNYILYRYYHQKIRETKSVAID